MISQGKQSISVSIIIPAYSLVCMFYSNIERFCQFVGGIIVEHTWDKPEDVFGGLHAMLNLSWREEGTKVSCKLNKVY